MTTPWWLLTQADCEADPLRTLRIKDLPARPLPLFLIVGSMKAGTSSLYSYINQHPQATALSLSPSLSPRPRTLTRTQSQSQSQSQSHGVVVTLTVDLNLSKHERAPLS